MKSKKEKIGLKKFELRYRLSVKSKQICICDSDNEVSKYFFISNAQSQALNSEKNP